MKGIEAAEQGSTIPVVGALVALYGTIQIFFVFLVFAELGILNLLFLLFWIPIVIAVAYIVFGFGLQERHLWAYVGLLTFIVLMLIVYIITIILIDDPLYDPLGFVHVVVHVSILLYLMWHWKEFESGPTRVVITEPGWEED